MVIGSEDPADGCCYSTMVVSDGHPVYSSYYSAAVSNDDNAENKDSVSEQSYSAQPVRITLLGSCYSDSSSNLTTYSQCCTVSYCNEYSQNNEFPFAYEAYSVDEIMSELLDKSGRATVVLTRHNDGISLNTLIHPTSSPKYTIKSPTYLLETNKSSFAVSSYPSKSRSANNCSPIPWNEPINICPQHLGSPCHSPPGNPLSFLPMPSSKLTHRSIDTTTTVNHQPFMAYTNIADTGESTGTTTTSASTGNYTGHLSHTSSPSNTNTSTGSVLLLGCSVLLWLLGQHAAMAAPSALGRGFVGDNTQRYLMQYGYLPQSDMEMGNLRTDHELVEAVRRLQRFGRLPVTGVVDRATKDLMKRPRCSLPDILPEEGPPPGPRAPQRRQRRYIKQGSSWDKTHLTWGIISYPGGGLDGRAVEREIHLATELWARPSKLTFSQLTEQPGTADIVVQFNRGYHGDGYPFDGEGRTLAHAFYPGSGIGGDIHFDADERWVQHVDSTNSSYDEISLFLTASHEMGHSLGLYHSQAKDSVMSPYLFSHGPGTFVLPRDDVAGIQDLYGVNDNYESVAGDSDLPPLSPSYPSSSPPSPPSTDDTQPPSTLVPETCDTTYDAVSVIRRGVYLFRGKYFWRIDDQTTVQEPVEISRFWYCLPPNITKIDAVYERPNHENIVFFSGRQYFVCAGNDNLVEFGPLRRLGLPETLDKLDAAFVWSHNSRTYFMADIMYWRFDESISHVELDYPRDMLMWKGVPYGGIDAAFTYNATTYFFKGKVFYEFDDLRMKVRPKSPLLSAPFWLGCPDNVANPPRPPARASSGASASSTGSLAVAAAAAAAVLLTSIVSASHISETIKFRGSRRWKCC